MAIITAPAELSGNAVNDFVQAALDAFTVGEYNLVADLTGTTSVDNAGMAAILTAHMRNRRYGGWTRIACDPRGPVAQFIREKCYTTVLVIADSVEAALIIPSVYYGSDEHETIRRCQKLLDQAVPGHGTVFGLYRHDSVTVITIQRPGQPNLTFLQPRERLVVTDGSTLTIE